MNTFLGEFAATLVEDEHAVLGLDRAGWHKAKRLVVPSNITLVWLPPHSPQINPVERLWLFLRERHLSHRLLDTYRCPLPRLECAHRRAHPQPHQLSLPRTGQGLGGSV